jgi:hypothetical protein
VPDANPINVTEENGVLRLAWNNRDVPKDNCGCVFLVFFWLIWAPVTVYVTVFFISQMMTWSLEDGIGSPLFFICWLIFGWLGTLLIPSTLLLRRTSEWIEISPTGIATGIYGLRGPMTRNHPFLPGMTVAIGFYEDDSMVSLSLLWTSTFGLKARETLGYWLAPRLKEQLFVTMQSFAERHKIPLEFKRIDDYHLS